MDIETANRLDKADALAPFRDDFVLPDDIIYLDGNSLGALPKATARRMADMVEQQWGQGLIRSWNDADWVDAPQRIGAKIAPLIGAHPDEVIVADSTSVNLFKLAMAAMQAQPDRRIILTESGNFPTDGYIAQGIADISDVTLRAVAPGQLADALDDLHGQVGLLLLTHVHYKTAAMHDIAALTAKAHATGALVLWDLSHSVGAVPLSLSADMADLAVGCGYKYLNGGPGAPAFIYVAKRHQAIMQSPITGWFGHAAPFDFSEDFAPAGDIARFLSGTPPILGLEALDVGVDLMAQAGIAAITQKSRQLTQFFIDIIQQKCADLAPELKLELVSPKMADQRGSHVSFRHPQGYAIVQALIARGVIGDFRSPDIVRFGFTPLYLRFADAYNAASALYEVLSSGQFNDAEFHQRKKVS